MQEPHTVLHIEDEVAQCCTVAVEWHKLSCEEGAGPKGVSKENGVDTGMFDETIGFPPWFSVQQANCSCYRKPTHRFGLFARILSISLNHQVEPAPRSPLSTGSSSAGAAVDPSGPSEQSLVVAQSPPKVLATIPPKASPHDANNWGISDEDASEDGEAEEEADKQTGQFLVIICGICRARSDKVRM